MQKKLERKYLPLAAYFRSASQPEFTLSFEAMETIMGQQLPNAAYLNKSWWKKTKPPMSHFLAWTEAGYHVLDVQPGKNVIFSTMNQEASGTVQNTDPDHFNYIIRSIEPEDARPLIHLHAAIDAESDFMLYGAGERELTVQGIRKRILQWKKEKNSTILLAIVNGELAGFLTILGHTAPRAKHRAAIVLGVQEAFANKGIASALLLHAEEWAKNCGISRLELTVMEQNERAINLYKKMGYQIEGTRLQAIYLNDEYKNELYMGKLL